eukprot:358392-Chlamydomonas_euryale.AAC.2
MWLPTDAGSAGCHFVAAICFAAVLGCSSYLGAQVPDTSKHGNPGYAGATPATRQTYKRYRPERTWFELAGRLLAALISCPGGWARLLVAVPSAGVMRSGTGGGGVADGGGYSHGQGIGGRLYMWGPQPNAMVPGIAYMDVHSIHRRDAAADESPAAAVAAAPGCPPAGAYSDAAHVVSTPCAVGRTAAPAAVPAAAPPAGSSCGAPSRLAIAPSQYPPAAETAAEITAAAAPRAPLALPVAAPRAAPALC